MPDRAEAFLDNDSRLKPLVARRGPNISSMIAAGGALVAIMIVLLFGLQLRREYNYAIQNTERELRIASTLLKEHAARATEAMDESLSAVVRAHEDMRSGALRDAAALHRRLAEIHAESPVYFGVGLVDASGNIVATSRFASPAPLNISNQESFQVQYPATGAKTHFAATTRSARDGNWYINVSRRLENPDGSFAGLAGIAVDPAYFARVFQAVELGATRAAMLFRNDGTLLARDPLTADWLGRSLAGTALWPDDRRAEGGAFAFRSPIDGAERKAQFARVEGTPLVIAVTVAQEDILSRFFQIFPQSLAIVSLVLVVLAAGTAFTIRQQRRRERSDRMFRGLLEAAPDAIVIVDSAGLIAIVNAQTEALFGYGREELLGKPVELLMPEESRAAHPRHRAAYHGAPGTRSMGSGLELRGQRKDGTIFPISVSLSPLRTDAGVLISSAIRDVTETKLREQELAAAKEAAQAANMAKSDFLSRMSHELRTPLNAIIGFGQMLQLNQPGNLTTDQQEYGEFILKGGRHLLTLVSEVLDLAGVEAGRIKISLERIEVAEIVNHAVETIRPVADKAGIRLEWCNENFVADVRADMQRLNQILLNLLSNAIKYNRPEGSVTVRVFTTGTGRVRIAVIDTGIGLSPANEAHLFEPFRRLGAEYTAVEGTGIGLALSKKLAEAMDGSIGYTTELGKGSTFWVELPAETGAAPRRDAPVEIAPSASPAAGYSLLYVEDNPANLRLMEHLIGTLPNVTLRSAPSGTLGLELAIACRPDVIVLDLNLPGMNGHEVHTRLKSLPETRDIPVIALTASAMPSEVRRGLAAGFFRYVTKPLEVNTFLAAIDAALRSRRASPSVAAGCA